MESRGWEGEAAGRAGMGLSRVSTGTERMVDKVYSSSEVGRV